MNRRQLISVWVGVVVVVAMMLYPPWRSDQFGYLGYHSFFSHMYVDEVYLAVLLCQWFVVALVTTAAVISFRSN